MSPTTHCCMGDTGAGAGTKLKVSKRATGALNKEVRSELRLSVLY